MFFEAAAALHKDVLFRPPTFDVSSKKQTRPYHLLSKGILKTTNTRHTCAATLFNFVLFCMLFLCPSVGFFFPVCRDQRSPAGRKRKDKHALFGPHCVQSTETGVKYQNDPKVEEVLHHQHSILVLHDPLQVDFTSLIWSSSYQCIISDPVFPFRGTFTDTGVVKH